MSKPAKAPAAPKPLKDQLAKLRIGKKTKEADLKLQVLPIAQAWLAEQREAAKVSFLATNDAEKLLAVQTGIIDTLLQSIYECYLQDEPSPVALVAVGGYGRGEFFPYSDIDLLFLYKKDSEEAAAKIAEFILYILWDLGLKVGQAHRNIDETLLLAREDFTIRTNLLDARFIAGEKPVFTQFWKRFEKEIIEGTQLEFVEAKLAERDVRHLHYGDSRYMLEPNVKEGKGGLRDLHTLWWIARYNYPIKKLKDLVDMKLLTAEEYTAFDNARQFLWRVRIHLHYQVGRPEERLSFDQQHGAAVGMGYAHPSMNRSIERFMRRYFVAVRTVGSITRIFCALLEDAKKRKPRKSLAWLWHTPWKLGGFRLDGERLNVRSDQSFDQNPIQMIELFRIAQMHGLDIHPHALQLMGRYLKRIDDDVRNDPRANALFMDILLAPQGPEVTLRRMSDAGVLGRFIPDFGRVIGQTQFNMYHVYTVDEHTIVALGILHSIEKKELHDELPLITEIIGRIKMRRVLYLALLCHDIAKGRGGDHSMLGEKIATRLAVRFGFSADEAETAAWLVRNHLLFSNTVFKRDIDDPKTVQDFVAKVQSPERLKLLLVLTAADIRAVGPTVWNEWKGSLLRDLYRRAEQSMGAGPVEIKQHQTGQFKQDLQKLMPRWKEADVDAYLEQGGPGFWANFDLPRHAMIARMLKQSKGMPLPLMIETKHDEKRAITEIILCTFDQHGLFSKIAGAMSLSGANIISAKIFTLKNGMAVDVFQVQDTSGEVFDRPDRLAKMSVYLEQALSGEIDLAEALSKRPPEYTNRSRNVMPVPGQVFVDNTASNIYSVIELTGRDRTGFLYQVTRTMAELGLSIATAHVSTYGTQAADVFYVKDIFGMKIDHEGKLKKIRETLLKTVNQN